MKFHSKGGRGKEGVEEILKGCLHSLYACLVLLVSNLMGKGNMGKPALAIGKGGLQKGVHSMLFNVVSFTKREVLEALRKLGMEVFSDLELCCTGSAFHGPIMYYTVSEDP